MNPLELLAKDHPLEKTRSGADELRIAIKTRGFVFETRRPADQTNEFQQAWKEVNDPLLPVQGHGIISLYNLLRKRNEEALQHKDQLLQLFISTLEHEDSYIYLVAIQALTALADVHTEAVLNALIQQLEDMATNSSSSPKLVEEIGEESTITSTTTPRPGGKLHRHRPPEIRLKVGEALLKVVRLIGPLVPKYKRTLLHSFLRGTRDEDPFVRTSCLQNLGELCGLLRYSLGAVIHEVK